MAQLDRMHVCHGAQTADKLQLAVARSCCSVSTTTAGLRVRETSTCARVVRLPGQFIDWWDGMWCDWHGMVGRRWTRTDGRHLNVRLLRVQTLRHPGQLNANSQTSSTYISACRELYLLCGSMPRIDRYCKFLIHHCILAFKSVFFSILCDVSSLPWILRLYSILNPML